MGSKTPLLLRDAEGNRGALHLPTAIADPERLSERMWAGECVRIRFHCVGCGSEAPMFTGDSRFLHTDLMTRLLVRHPRNPARRAEDDGESYISSRPRPDEGL